MDSAIDTLGTTTTKSERYTDPEVNDRIIVACGANDQYAMPLAVTLFSMISHLPVGSSVEIFILSLGISIESQERVRAVLCADRILVSVQFFEIDRSRLAELPEIGHFGAATYLRFILPDLLPTNYSKVIYLDSDLLVRHDITPLWQTPLSDKLLMATQDCHVPTVSSEGGILHWQQLGMSADALYFNAGVVLINLKKWRKVGLCKNAFAHIVENRDVLLYPDQDALNTLCYGDWGLLDLKWNIPTLQLTDFANWAPSTLTDYIAARFELLRFDPCICHFTTKKKPWVAGFRVPFQREWFDALRRSGWFTAKDYLAWHWKWTIAHYQKGIQRRLSREEA